MNKTLKNILIASSSMALAALFIIIGLSTQRTLADSGMPNTLKTMTTTGVSVGTTSTAVIPASSGRVYGAFVDDGSSPIYLTLGPTAVDGQGIRLNANGGSYEINLSNDYIGTITAIATPSVANLTVTYSQ